MYMKELEIQKSADEIREFFKRWPKLYYVIVYIFGPAYLGHMTPKNFLSTYFSDSKGNHKILNLGSGPRVIREDILNVDITKYSKVSIVASLTDLPIENASIDGFVCDNVLEHVADFNVAVHEMYRVLKVGGVGYVSTPFMYPFHASPDDYTRWTEKGLRHLFKDFEIVEVGTRSGIFSTINVTLCYFLPTLFSFGSDRLYWFLVNLSLFIFFPIKFLDICANRLPFSTRTASILYCVVRKHA
jgi:SAM-dependent methyltransferase